jgi:hypothetical protein
MLLEFPNILTVRGPGSASRKPFDITPMADPHQQITDLEADITDLSDAADRCRKGMILAKVAIAVGVLLFVACLLGLIRRDPIVLVIGIAAALAGVGFYGSSRGSLEELTEKIRACEARRAAMIDGMDLRTVPDQERHYK